MNSLFFDTETSGFYDSTKPLNHPKQGRLMELACILVSGEGEILSEYCTLVKPEVGYDLADGAFKAHGISLERAESEGIPIKEALTTFVELCDKADCATGNGRLIAHNLRFDMGIMQSEFSRLEVSSRPMLLLKPFCTMLALTDIVRIQGKYGKYKWPTLSEAHKHFFNEEFEGAHSALGDTRAMRRVYNEAVAKGHFKL